MKKIKRKMTKEEFINFMKLRITIPFNVAPCDCGFCYGWKVVETNYNIIKEVK